jgi:WD40 repeat protein
VAFSPNGDRLATGGYDGEVRVFPMDDPKHPKIMPGDQRNVRQLSFSPDGKTIAAASSTVRVWKYGSKKPPTRYGTDQNYFAVAYEPKNGVLAWAENTRVRLGEQTLFKGGELLTWLAYDPAGTRLAAADQVGNIRLFNAQSRKPIVSFNPNGHAVNAVAFNPDGTRIAVVAGNQVTIWDTATPRQPLIALDGGLKLLTTVAFSPDGTLIAAAGDDAQLRIWRV